MEDQEMKKNRVCKFCNKRFACGKSLGGHIRSHMMKKVEEKSKLDSISSTNGYVLRENPKRSWRFVDSHPNSSVLHNDDDHSWTNNENMQKRSSLDGSSSISEIEHEQEEVAMCLMMLSRDSRDSSMSRVGLNMNSSSSSDNNSMVWETRSYSGCLDTEIVQCENSDSGYFVNDVKKVDSEVSVDGYFRVDDTKRKRKLEFGSGIEGSDFGRNYPNSPKNVRLARDIGNSELKRSRNDKNSQKIKYECLVCHKIFHSYQALGGHKASHNKINEDYNENIEELEPKNRKNNIENIISSKKTKKIRGPRKKRGHQCPICHKIFSSGQALGGHKRSHSLGTFEDRTADDKSLKISALIDLNLPAPIDDDDENEF